MRDFDVMTNTHFDRERAKALADATDENWKAILDQDIVKFGSSLRAMFEAQVAMFPAMLNERVSAVIEKYRDMALGWKLTGAGGGGYLVLASDKPIPHAVRIVARRESE